MRACSRLALALLAAACATPAAPPDAAPADASACLAPGISTAMAAGASYELHVPAAHRCDVPSALLVALPGAPDDGAWAALDALSEAEGFVLARSDARDVAAIEALVAALPSIDPARLYLVGSGSGATLAGRFLREGTLVPRGIALLDYDAPADSTPLRALDPRPRLWLSTGERSLGIDAQNALRVALADAGHDGYTLRVRARDSGPATAAWLAAELWAWLDHAQWPENGPPALPWIRAQFPVADASLLSVDAMPDGTFVAGSADGRVFGTNDSGKWSLLAELGEGPLVGVVARSGAPSIASTRGFIRSADGLAFARDPAPSVGSILALADDTSAIYGVVADGTIVVSRDRDRTWSALGTLERAEAIAVSPVTHTVLVVGQGGAYARLAPDVVSHPLAARLHDVAVGADGTFWMVGADATVLRSTDDGLTFAPVVDPEGRHLDDLYCVAIGADGAMIAGGARGTVVVSHDGATLTLWLTSGQGYVGAVRWLEPGRAMILGERSLAAVGDGL